MSVTCSAIYNKRPTGTIPAPVPSQGATLVLLDLPPRSEFGIDMVAWNTAERFKGVKMIPQGVHFVYWR